MKKFVSFVLIALFVLSFSTITLAEEASESEPQINRTVNLHMEEKSPNRAYSFSLFPIFGPESAAQYVGYSPVHWEGREELNSRAKRQAIFNIAEIGGGAIAGGFAFEETGAGVGLGLTVGTIVALVHNHFFGLDMAESAVTYNQNLYDEFDWTTPQVKIEF